LTRQSAAPARNTTTTKRDGLMGVLRCAYACSQVPSNWLHRRLTRERGGSSVITFPRGHYTVAPAQGGYLTPRQRHPERLGLAGRRVLRREPFATFPIPHQPHRLKVRATSPDDMRRRYASASLSPARTGHPDKAAHRDIPASTRGLPRLREESRRLRARFREVCEHTNRLTCLTPPPLTFRCIARSRVVLTACQDAANGVVGSFPGGAPMRKFVCALVVTFCVISLAVADEGLGRITKVEGKKVTFVTGKKDAKQTYNLTRTATTKVVKGNLDTDTKKVKASGPLAKGEVKGRVEKAGEGGVIGGVVTDGALKDGATITEIRVLSKKGAGQ